MKFFRFAFLFLTALSFAQPAAKVDFKTVDAIITPDINAKSVTAKARYHFNVIAAIDTIRIDAFNMDFTGVSINDKKVGFKNSGKALLLYTGFKKGKNILSLEYSCKPKQTMYFTGNGNEAQIWTQGQGKSTSHWLPSFDDVNEKLIFNISVCAPVGFEAISNGVLERRSDSGILTQWDYKMCQPMSSYLAMIAVGKFAKKTEKSKSGKSLLMYLQPKDSAKFEPTYRYTKQIFDYFESEIGVAYPWETYKQVPVRDFLYAGMENTSATVFAQDFVVDEVGFADKNYVNVNAHELAHQWFGDMVTAKSGKHHWLQEGFATYYALLAEREVFGEDHFNWKLYEMAGTLQQASKTDSVPILNEKASALTFYQKGAWALHALRESIGAEAFRKAVRNYLSEYAFKNVDTGNFLSEVAKVSNFDENAFRKNWLENPSFHSAEALSILKKSQFMQQFFEVQSMAGRPLPSKEARFAEILKSGLYHPIKEEVLFQLAEVPFAQKEKLIDIALESSNVAVRQAVATSLDTIPTPLYEKFFALLDDRSYITKEIVAGRLWQQFPDKRQAILDKTDKFTGFNDQNLRIQWLTLALMTKDFRPSEKVNFYDELLSYAQLPYESSARQNALESLLFLNPNDKNVLPLLINPLVHHKWQFSKFAREKVRESIKKDSHRLFFEKQVEQLPENEKIQLRRLLDEKPIKSP